MSALVRTYGRTLTGTFVFLTAAWLLGMIVIPQLFMIERSLWVRQESTQLSLEIDRLYNEVSLLRFDAQSAAGADKPAIEDKISGIEERIAELETQEKEPQKVYTLSNYSRMSGLHFRIFVRTIIYAAMVTVLALVVCYPIAFAVARVATPQAAAFLMLGLIIPYAINELLRVYAWLMILDYQGVLNTFLDWIGVTNLAAKQWIPFLESPAAVFVAMVYTYILFMVFPIYNTLETLDRNQLEAARDLGAPSWRIHWRVAIPHAKPGIAVGCIMTFMLSAGSYSVPQIMTRGTSGDWFSQTIYRQFFESNNWNVGAAYAFTLLVVCIVFIFLMMLVFRVGVRDIAR
ncbi:ABC transporter permease [Microbaculum sp. FT89]|uniref:ABC transporter permease n=1 Tax=Microbaculum sp. FT89 TaxID=3447298 RepID=UPI003F531753